MPLPPALAAKLAKRGLIHTTISLKNKENASSAPKFVEEVIAESYDDPKTANGAEKVSAVPDPSSVPGSAGGAPLLALNRKISKITRFHRMGHYGCPNKTNIYHTCTQFCVTRWGRGKSQPSSEYNKRRLKMLRKYPLPSSWIEVYDPGTGRYYYWETETDHVCWHSPNHPKAKVGKAAPDLRERMQENEKASLSMPPPSAPSSSSFQSSDRRAMPRRDKRRMPKDMEELDPMDPASYSDIPRGTWSTGLRPEEVTGVDSTATGPLFQQRPYPSPGEILRANADKKQKK